MLNIFTLAHGRLVQEEIDSSEALAHVRPVWVDLEAPNADEKAWVHARFGIAIPDDIVDDDIIIIDIVIERERKQTYAMVSSNSHTLIIVARQCYTHP